MDVDSPDDIDMDEATREGESDDSYSANDSEQSNYSDSSCEAVDINVALAEAEFQKLSIRGNLHETLLDFFQKYDLSLTARRACLQIFRNLDFKELPVDPRTLESDAIKRKPITSFAVEENSFIYLGVQNQLEQIVKQQNCRPTEIKLHFNMDGIPLYKSSSREYWPILMSTNLDPRTVSVIAVYFGVGKPSAELYLVNLVAELGTLLVKGLDDIPVSVEYLVCDIPAVSFLKGTKNATAYHACTKCTVHGAFYKPPLVAVPASAVPSEAARPTPSSTNKSKRKNKNPTPARRLIPPSVFQPQKKGNMFYIPDSSDTLRTNETFRSKVDTCHHQHKPAGGPYGLIEPLESQFEALPCHLFDLVECFTVDGMHTAFLGVVRRLLRYWRQGRKVPGDADKGRVLSNNEFLAVGKRWAKLKFPHEFSRPTRKFDLIDRYKAVELRMLTLYGGDQIFVPEMKGLALEIWRLFTTAIRILSDPDLVKNQSNITLASQMIAAFLEKSVERFQTKFIAYCVHLLCHLPAEVEKFGALDSFSCFKYENILKTIKGLSQRSFLNPMATLTKKLKLVSSFTSKPTRILCDRGDPPQLRQRHWTKNCPMRHVKQYRGIAFNCILLTSKKPNCYFRAKGQILKARNILINRRGTIFILASRYNNCKSSYIVELPSKPVLLGKPKQTKQQDDQQQDETVDEDESLMPADEAVGVEPINKQPKPRVLKIEQPPPFRSSTIGLCTLGKLEHHVQAIGLNDVDYKLVVHKLGKTLYCWPLLNL